MREQPENQFDGATIVDVLRHRALREPEARGYTFLADGEQKEVALSYKELDRRARVIATMLRSAGAAGKPVLLVLPSGLEFIAAFFGCLYAGSIVVTAYPPRPNRPVQRLAVIAKDSGASVVLTLEAVRSQCETRVAELDDIQALNWITVDRIDGHESAEWLVPSIDEQSIALLQYTSGSTGLPKGTMVSHGNIMHNSKVIRMAFQHSHQSVVVGWLPMTHDMGLIGNMLQPLYVGCPLVFMAPEHFLIKPIRWLRAISRYRATTSGGPNFAYDYCSQRIKPELRDELDLSRWDLAFNGAEPIRSKTMERFTAEFSPYGFRRETFYPCYGLAESTLFVTGGSKSAAPVARRVDADELGSNRVVVRDNDDDSGRVLTGCGQSWLDQHVVIVDPEDCRSCPEGSIGEIWIAGPSIAQGYWNNALETERAFEGFLKDNGQGPFLRSGDLGFFQDGELFVCGRLKDLIIISGSNHFPSDIELTVENCHHAIRPNSVAAVSADFDGVERLVVIAEIDRHFLTRSEDSGSDAQGRSTSGIEEIKTAIREGVARNHDLSAHEICLIRQSTLPRTASAKIQRHLCRNKFLAGELTLVQS